MIGRTNAGGGSAAVHLVSRLTEPTPSEGLIWIVSDTRVKGWVFAADVPEGVEGRVWIKTGSSSSVAFNAITGNVLQVYPISASQYIGGEWVDVEAKTYLNGEWVAWRVWLVDNGFDKPENSGGWQAAVKRLTNFGFSTTPSLSIADGTFAFSISSGGDYTGYSGIVISKADIDVSSFSKLRCTGYATSSAGGYRAKVSLSLINRSATYAVTNAAASGYGIDITGTLLERTDFDVELDITALSGAYAVALGAQVQNPGSAMKVTITAVYFD